MPVLHADDAGRLGLRRGLTIVEMFHENRMTVIAQRLDATLTTELPAFRV